MPPYIRYRQARGEAFDSLNEVVKLLGTDDALDEFHAGIVSQLLQVRKKTNVARTNKGMRMSPEYTINPPKDGVSMSCLVAILFTMKFGALPMEVMAPMNTDPQEI